MKGKWLWIVFLDIDFIGATAKEQNLLMKEKERLFYRIVALMEKFQYRHIHGDEFIGSFDKALGEDKVREMIVSQMKEFQSVSKTWPTAKAFTFTAGLMLIEQCQYDTILIKKNEFYGSTEAICKYNYADLLMQRAKADKIKDSQNLGDKVVFFG